MASGCKALQESARRKFSGIKWNDLFMVQRFMHKKNVNEELERSDHKDGCRRKINKIENVFGGHGMEVAMVNCKLKKQSGGLSNTPENVNGLTLTVDASEVTSRVFSYFYHAIKQIILIKHPGDGRVVKTIDKIGQKSELGFEVLLKQPTKKELQPWLLGYNHKRQARTINALDLGNEVEFGTKDDEDDEEDTNSNVVVGTKLSHRQNEAAARMWDGTGGIIQLVGGSRKTKNIYVTCPEDFTTFGISRMKDESIEGHCDEDMRRVCFFF